MNKWVGRWWRIDGKVDGCIGSLVGNGYRGSKNMNKCINGGGRQGLLSLIVSQCDSLGRDLEVNNGGSWRGVSGQSLGCGFGNGLWPSE